MNFIDHLTYSCDAPAFARDVLKFHPDPVQLRLLTTTPSRCILNCTRQWGKSTITAIKALHQALFHVDSLVIVLSPSDRQSGEFIRKVSEFVQMAGIKPRGDGRNPNSLLFPNKSRIVGLPSNEHTIRGFSGVALLLIDEASRVPDELYKTVRPMLAVSRGALWLISTPFGRQGFFYDTWESGDPEWTRISVRATDCPRIASDFLEKERREQGEHRFRQEYLCEFHDFDDQLISQEFIDMALSTEVAPLPVAPRAEVAPLPAFQRVCVYPRDASAAPIEQDRVIQYKLYLGVDFGQAQDYTAIAIIEKAWVLTGPINHWNYERTREERYAVRHLERLPLGTPYTEAVARVGQIVRSMDHERNLWISADATGVGRPVIEKIRELQTGRMLQAVTITSGNTESNDSMFYHVPKSHLINNLILQFESGLFKVAAGLKMTDTLLRELASLRIKVSNAGNEIYSTWRRDQHDDLLFAVALANWQAQKDKWYGPQQRLYW